MRQTKNPILQAVSNWVKRNFSSPEAIALLFTIVFAIVFLEFLGKFLLPAFISIVIAYLLLPAVRLLERWRFPNLLAVLIVYFIFLGLFLLALFGLLPLIWKQLASVVHELPRAFSKSQLWINELMLRYPKVLPSNPLEHGSVFLKEQSVRIGQFILHFSLASIPGIIEAILYLVLIPLLVFFFLKDGKSITAWFAKYLPHRRGMLQVVWSEVNQKIGVYVKGRVAEIIIVGVVSVVTFSLLGLQYSILLGTLVGVSVIVPYIGAVVVTVPIVIIGLMQWGFAPDFIYLMIAYLLIITLDGNLLVPILFSETMDIHPIVIILSVLVFGGIWGFWGVFFAIPLATLLKAILNAWPKAQLPVAREEGAQQECPVEEK
ncbi:AI-2E family transporter [Candidiatus Paracoxiella cheracis]|uniref:AI-2E family transporter n=1 Tax=Candidiatus Paracoxiella cheracis TaxID=3405120 RepID=UPI003BF47407